MDAIQDFIKHLKTAREQKKLSQQELANKVGIPQSHLSKIESGAVNPRLSIIIELARTLGLEPMLIPVPKMLIVESILRAGTSNDAVTPAYLPDKEDDND